jgi:transcriptional regulator with XRE-family HTH domain
MTADVTQRRLDPATFQALQALMARGQMQVGEALAGAIRARRLELGASVKSLAEQFEVDADTFQEVERGGCMISAPTLVNLARALDVDLVWFIEREPLFFAGTGRGGPFDAGSIHADGFEALELLRVFASIRDPAAREKVIELARRFANDDGDAPDRK